jgi:6-phosphogluconolactonase
MIVFNTKKELEEALCKQIANDLQQAIVKKGSATLLLSGGSTPSGVYRLLSHEEIDWSLVYIGLVDERFVPAEHMHSNYKLLLESIVQNNAAQVRVYPMVLDELDYVKNLSKIEESYRIFTEPDVVLLGMGPDGHTASIFPNDAASQLANEQTDCLISNTNAPADPKQRITLNGPVLRRANSLYLMITGADKKQILENSSALNLPIAAFKSSLKNIYYTSAS